MKRCSVEGCERRYRCSGYCGLHYDRVRAHGSPLLVEKPQKTCSVDGCGRRYYANDMCSAHSQRVARSGEVKSQQALRQLPLAKDRADIVSRIMRKTTRTASGCVQWTGLCLPNGYGQISWHGRAWVVHRAIWTVIVGPIPTDGDWTLDHLCSNRGCVNVGHLEVVTRWENTRRGGGLEKAQAANARQRHERLARECEQQHRDDHPDDRRTP